MQETMEIQELSLEKVIDSKLVQANVTEMVLNALKEKYGGMKLADVEDKESYLELKAAAKECAKVRTLTVKLCKEGREEAVKAQKTWIAKEKEIVGKIAEVEDALDSEIKRFDDNVARLVAEEKQRQEEAYINRQATLTKLGATYIDGSFVLGEASFEAALVKGMDNEIWESSVVPKFQAEYEKIQAEKVAEEKRKAAEIAAMLEEQTKMLKEKEEFKKQQEEFKREQEKVAQAEREKALALENEMLLAQREAQFKIMQEQAEKAAEEKRLADIEAAIKKEKERQEFEALQAEQHRKIEEARKAEELASASDKVKWQEFISQVAAIDTFEMRSGQYRKKMQIAKEKLEEILSL